MIHLFRADEEEDEFSEMAQSAEGMSFGPDIWESQLHAATTMITII